jgi:hypothetical protein
MIARIQNITSAVRRFTYQLGQAWTAEEIQIIKNRWLRACEAQRQRELIILVPDLERHARRLGFLVVLERHVQDEASERERSLQILWPEVFSRAAA